MRRKLKNLKNKSGHSENGAPRQMIDEAVYREHWSNQNVVLSTGDSPHWDARYSGWSNARRPLDYPISLRAIVPFSPQ